MLKDSSKACKKGPDKIWDTFGMNSIKFKWWNNIMKSEDAIQDLKFDLWIINHELLIQTLQETKE